MWLRRRVLKLKKKMELLGLDAFVVAKSGFYFSGTTACKMVVIPSDGEPILICSRLERERAAAESWIKDVRAFSAWKAPLRSGERVYFMRPHELLDSCLESIGARFVGYEGLPSSTVRALKKTGKRNCVELSKWVQELRAIKDPSEIKLLRKSAQIASRGMRAALETLRPGIREIDVAAQAEYEMRKRGSTGTPFPTIVASGKNSALPHASATEKKIRRGELVVIDLGATYRGYASDCTRTWGVGLSKKRLRLVEIVKRAQKSAVARLRDGMMVKEICAAANQVLNRAGLLRDSLHGLGHGVGIEIHELPSLYPGSKEVLKSGMVLTVEPGVYCRNIGGARWEDMFLIKKNDAEQLTMTT